MASDFAYGEIIDTRDLIARMADIEAELEDEDLDEDERTALAEELAEIRAAEDAGIPDWPYGAALIREDYFTEYAQELAEDIGAISRDATWPSSYIDWEAAAEALKQDYTTVELAGFTYYARA